MIMDKVPRFLAVWPMPVDGLIDLNADYTGAGVIIGQNNFQLRITAAKT
jgi:hypothetical protein